MIKRDEDNEMPIFETNMNTVRFYFDQLLQYKYRKNTAQHCQTFAITFRKFRFKYVRFDNCYLLENDFAKS